MVVVVVLPRAGKDVCVLFLIVLSKAGLWRVFDDDEIERLTEL